MRSDPPIARGAHPTRPFLLTYLLLELRQRLRQSILIGAGLAVWVGLVITVGGAAAGTRKAEAGVLHALYGVATDVVVTRPYTHHDGQPGHEVPAPGIGPVRHLEYLSDANQGLFASSALAAISRLPGVGAAVGMLALDQSDITVGGNSKPPASGVPPTFLVDGVDTADQRLGPLSQARVIAGRGLTAADARSDVALVDAGYARAHHLHPGSVITLHYKPFRVVGIVSQPAGTVPAVLIPLGPAQAASGLSGKLTEVYVKTKSTQDVGAVAAEIRRQLPWANATTAGSLAGEIQGSLATMATLAADLGRWLAGAALAAAFVLAAVLTLAAVSRRTREFGTLKALGWRARRITAQVLTESAVIGTVGALVGVGLGYAGAGLISLLAATLMATAAASPGHSEPRGFVGGVVNGHPFSRQLTDPGTYSSVPVHFTAPVSPEVVGLAVAIGIAGGLLAGALGGWRTARMRPTAALAHVE